MWRRTVGKIGRIGSGLRCRERVILQRDDAFVGVCLIGGAALGRANQCISGLIRQSPDDQIDDHHPCQREHQDRTLALSPPKKEHCPTDKRDGSKHEQRERSV